ncbi:MAG: hypothetical protein ACRD0K_22790 [Egibacteraceae bacterium]
MTRALLTQRFGSFTNSPLKTFIIEAHVDQPDTSTLRSLTGGDQVEATEDAYLFQLRSGNVELWVDTLDPRFWSVYTWSSARESKRYIKALVERRRDLDWAWLPSAHLQRAWPGQLRWLRSSFEGSGVLSAELPARDLRIQVAGADSENLLSWIAQNEAYASAVAYDRVGFIAADDHFSGQADEILDRMGRFVASGTSFELHQELVRSVIERYADLVRKIEQRALKYEPLPDGGYRAEGAPILLRFSRRVPDVDLLVDELFSSREPFRLWGEPQMLEPDRVWVDAVDLHVGQRVGFDITDASVRVHLPAGACGNTVVRLVANLLTPG